MTDADFLALLACPLHGGPLAAAPERMSCSEGCDYPRFGEVAFLLPREIAHTHRGIAQESFEAAAAIGAGTRPAQRPEEGNAIDPFVQRMIGHTNSNLYHHLAGHLHAYPIPEFPMTPPRAHALLLDIGCGWGRWSIAAARRGFAAIGIDPSLDAALAAARVAKQLGVEVRFVVGDSRYLPFRAHVFDAAFSYSVLQHFSKADVTATLRSLARAMKPGGISKLHLLNRWGLRSLQVQLRHATRAEQEFETRYWSPKEMIEALSDAIGPSRLEVDGFFVQGRYEDRALFKPHHRALVEASRLLSRAAEAIPLLTNAADNLFVVSRVEERPRAL
jgi:SAM-dependent methyltransferase